MQGAQNLRSEAYFQGTPQRFTLLDKPEDESSSNAELLI